MKIRAIMLFIALLATASGAAAQTSRGTVSGTVIDPAGAVVPGVSVLLTNNDTGTTRTTVSNDEGLYRFEAVDLGAYSVNFTGTGFGATTKTNIVVNANQVSTVDAQLQPGVEAVTIDVISEAGAALQTEAPVRGGNISTQQITELPIFSRNPVSLALTLPGVSSNRGAFGVGTFSVNGARGRSNNFLIDGTDNNDISVAGQGFQITNPDAVQEVSVQTSNYDAEFGRAGGAVVNVITKAGTNEFHGTLSTVYDSRRDDALTSSESRDPANILRGNPPSGTENIFAGTIGGPVILPGYNGRNRTFFFGSYQEDRQRSSAQAQFVTPTAAGRARLRELFPAGTNANVDLYLGITENAVGVASPTSIALGSGRGSVEFGSFFRTYPNLFIERQWQTRIDHKIGDNDQLSGRFLWDRQKQPLANINLQGFEADAESRYYNFLVTETHIFSPTLTNEARIAYNRLQLGAPLSDPDGPGSTLPRIDIQNVASLGTAATFPQGRIANNYVVQDTMTKLVGDHTFRFGIDYLRQIATQLAPANPRGNINYQPSTGFTAFANFVDNVGGNNGVATRDFGSSVYFPSLHRTAAFFQDRWKYNDALTLTLGLRYENFGTPFNTLRTPAFTGLFNIDPVTLEGPYNQPNKIASDKNNFAPTLGIAYSPSFTEGVLGTLFGDRKSAIRAGYQIGYDSFFNNIASNAASSPPNLISTTVTSLVNAANPRGVANFSSQLPTAAGTVNPRGGNNLIAPDLVNPYYQRWSLGIQRELPLNLIVDMSYVGSKGTKLYITEELNPLVRPEQRITPAGYTGAVTGRLDNLQGSRAIRTNGGSSIYHAGQVEVRRRFADNLSISGAYTFSKLIDNFSEVFGQTGTTSGAFFALPPAFGGERLDRAVGLFDRTHRASFTYVYEIPFMREQRGFVGRVLGGWQISGVTTFESGVPYTVFNGLDSDGIGGGFERPTHNPQGQRGVRAVPVVNAQNFITGYVNPDAANAPINPADAEFIVNPTFVPGLAGSVARFGNLGRNTARTPGTNNFNVNFQKGTRIGEDTRLEFRTEFYNIFNHPQYTQPSVSPFSPLGGAISSNANSALAGRFLNPNTPATDGGGRVIRYQLKLVF